MKRLPAGAVVLCAISLVLAACSGVPRSSRPEVIQTVDRAGDAASTPPAAGPAAGADPRSIVQGFLAEALRSTSGARQFLTIDAQSKWQPAPLVVVSGFSVPITPALGEAVQLTVTANNRIGQIDATGVYTPDLKADASGDQQPETFGLKKVDGQWRIDSPPPDVLVSQSDFVQNYRPEPLYFFDNGTETTLVPDQRYTSLQKNELVSWLMAQLLVGPRPELTSSVSSEVPTQNAAKPITVTYTDPNLIQVEIPSAAQLDPPSRRRLAEQLAYTLGSTRFAPSAIEITDGGRPVTISTSLGTTFSYPDFPDLGPETGSSSVNTFYLRAGQLVSGLDQKPVPLAIGAAGLGLNSIAVKGGAESALQVIAVSGSKVLISSADGKFSPVAGLPNGTKSRPDWQPGTSNAWIGVGSGTTIYRISASGVTKAVSITAVRGTSPQGQIVTLRFSPDGARLAAVLNGIDGTKSVWVGSVVRSAGADVRIDSFEPITAANFDVLDVGWKDSSTLDMIAADQSRTDREPAVYKLMSDGSQVVEAGLGGQGLPSPPELLAEAPGQSVIVAAGVSTDPTLWEPAAGSWQPLVSGPYTSGTSPVYSD